jgi:hypothetical protein
MSFLTPQFQLRRVVVTLERIASEIADPKYAQPIQAHAEALGELAELFAQPLLGLNALTPQQARVLSFIRQRIAERDEAPTRKEIAEAFSFASPNAAQEHLRALERKGVITLTGCVRGIRINKRPSTLTLNTAAP